MATLIVYAYYNECGYEVLVRDKDGQDVEYSAGNGRGDSQLYLSPDDPEALPLEKIRENVNKTAKELAKEFHALWDNGQAEYDENLFGMTCLGVYEGNLPEFICDDGTIAVY